MAARLPRLLRALLGIALFAAAAAPSPAAAQTKAEAVAALELTAEQMVRAFDEARLPNLQPPDLEPPSINVTGTANVIRHALPALAADGVIVNVSSTWGRSAAGRQAPYCASKFAVEALTQSLAQELPNGMAAVAVNPGVIATEMLETAFEGDVSAFPTPEALVPSWLGLLSRIDASWNGRSLDL